MGGILSSQRALTGGFAPCPCLDQCWLGGAVRFPIGCGSRSSGIRSIGKALCRPHPGQPRLPALLDRCRFSSRAADQVVANTQLGECDVRANAGVTTFRVGRGNRTYPGLADGCPAGDAARLAIGEIDDSNQNPVGIAEWPKSLLVFRVDRLLSVRRRVWLCGFEGRNLLIGNVLVRGLAGWCICDILTRFPFAIGASIGKFPATTTFGTRSFHYRRCGSRGGKAVVAGKDQGVSLLAKYAFVEQSLPKSDDMLPQGRCRPSPRLRAGQDDDVARQSDSHARSKILPAPGEDRTVGNVIWRSLGDRQRGLLWTTAHFSEQVPSQCPYQRFRLIHEFVHSCPVWPRQLACVGCRPN